MPMRPKRYPTSQVEYDLYELEQAQERKQEALEKRLHVRRQLINIALGCLVMSLCLGAFAGLIGHSILVLFGVTLAALCVCGFVAAIVFIANQWGSSSPW